jgi:lysophospholipase L1-like esterase
VLKRTSIVIVLSLIFCILYNNITISEPVHKMDNIDLNRTVYSDYYIDRVTTFMNSDSGQGKIVFLGDSITDICEWSEILDNPDILNRGISGDTTTGALNRLSEIIRLKPRKIFIMLGINDIGKCREVSSIIKDYGKILSTIKEELPDTGIYVQSVLPINKDIFKTHTEEEEIVVFNNALMKLCEDTGVHYINLYQSLTIGGNKLNPDYTTGGLHLNGKGYSVWKNVVKEYCK